ncbi:MAG: lamin tail domain-containing protein, partial [Patescibacteria group bacterium]
VISGDLPLFSIFGELARLERVKDRMIAYLKNVYSGTKAESRPAAIGLQTSGENSLPPSPAAVGGSPQNAVVAFSRAGGGNSASPPTQPKAVPNLVQNPESRTSSPTPDNHPPLPLIFEQAPDTKTDGEFVAPSSTVNNSVETRNFASSSVTAEEPAPSYVPIPHTPRMGPARVEEASSQPPPSPLAHPDTTPPLKPTISSPAGAEYLTNQNQITLSGEKSEDTAIIDIEIVGLSLVSVENIIITGFSSSTAWSKELDLPSGEHQIKIKAKDAAGNASESAEIKITIDGVAPTVAFINFQAIHANPTFEISWSGEDKIAVSSAIAGAIDAYNIEWRGSSGVWQSLATTTEASVNFFGENNSAYAFRARGTDRARNVGVWTESPTTTVRLPHLVISEVQIGGATAGDEFVELYNPTASSVDITGWKLSRITASGGTSENLLRPFPSATISARGFYLITHPTDYTGAVTPDAIYSTTKSLAPNNTVALYDANGAAVDALGFGEAAMFEGAPAPGLSSNGNSLERKANLLSTVESMLPGGEDELAGNGEDTDNNAADFILRASSDPQNSESASEPEIDTEAKPGRITDLAAALTETTTSSVRLIWSSPENAAIEDDAIYDIRYLPQVLPAGCLLNILWSQAARVSPSLSPNEESGSRETITVSGLGANNYYCFGVKTWNGYRWSDLSNLYVVHTLKTGATVAERGTYFPDPVGNAIVLTPDNNPYIVVGDITIKKNVKLTIQPGVIIKFKPFFYSKTGQFTSRLLIVGELDARGTADNQIIFTSLYDDRFGGDTDGAVNIPAKGDWAYLDFSGGAAPAVIQYANFYFGGDSTGGGNSGGAIFFWGTRPLAVSDSLFENNHAGIVGRNQTGAANLTPLIVRNSTFRANTYGLMIVEGMTFEAAGNTFENNRVGFYTNGLRADSAVLRGNNFLGNILFGAQNQGAVILDARENWWGDVSGPKHASNDGGAGDKASDKINFSEWSSEKF